MEQLGQLRYVAAGGAAGALLRWGILEVAPSTSTSTALIVINVVGSFLLGTLIGMHQTTASRNRVTDNQYLLLGTGFAGSFTTFSSYAVDLAQAIDSGAIGDALRVSLTTALAALVAAGIGYRVGSRR